MNWRRTREVQAGLLEPKCEVLGGNPLSSSLLGERGIWASHDRHSIHDSCGQRSGTNMLCDLKQATQPLCASVFLSVKWAVVRIRPSSMQAHCSQPALSWGMTPYLSMDCPVCLGGKFCGPAMQRELGFLPHEPPWYGQADRGRDAGGEKPDSTERRHPTTSHPVKHFCQDQPGH